MKRFSVITSTNIMVTAPNLDKIVRVTRHIKFTPVKRIQVLALCALTLSTISNAQVIYYTNANDMSPVLLVYLLILGVAFWLVYKSISLTRGRVSKNVSNPHKPL